MKILTTLFASVAVCFMTASVSAAEVVVYSARNEQLIKPLFDAYTKETGVLVKFITDKEGALLQRLKAEGQNTPADMLITVDAGNLWEAARAGLLKPVQSRTLSANVPAHLRDPGNQWFGLSVRARTIFFNNQKVKPADLSTYEDLGNAKWKGRLCLRTSKKVYNQSLVAMMIAEHGEAKTEQIVKSWVANLATEPFPDDTKMLEAIAAGQCDVGIANTYYFGRLLEWLSSVKAQNLFADVNMEYPVNPAVKTDPVVAAWGSFKQNPLNVAKAGELQAAAVKLMDRASYR